MSGVEGYMYPNEVTLLLERADRSVPLHYGAGGGRIHSGVAGARLPRGGGEAYYRLALLTALAFLLVAPLPLQLHLGHPERSPEMYFTPHATSAMAMFGYVYLWYLMAVLVFEIWLDYRRDIVLLSQSTKGLLRLILQGHDAGLQQHQRALAAHR